jgi:hypothetical protein
MTVDYEKVEAALKAIAIVVSVFKIWASLWPSWPRMISRQTYRQNLDSPLTDRRQFFTVVIVIIGGGGSGPDQQG